MKGPMKILLAVDGSPPSKAATRSLAERPWPGGTTVRVLSVAHPIYPVGHGMLPVGIDYDRITRHATEEAQRLAAEGSDELARAGLKAEPADRKGDPRHEIVEEAQRWGADLVVVGSHGRTGVERWLIGSVAEHVVRHAPCSVEVARTGGA